MAQSKKAKELLASLTAKQKQKCVKELKRLAWASEEWFQTDMNEPACAEMFAAIGRRAHVIVSLMLPVRNRKAKSK